MTPYLTMDEAAAMLRISRRTLQELIKGASCYTVGRRRKLFTPAQIEALACRSSSSAATAPPPGTSAGPSEALLLTRARALTTAPRRRRSESAKSTACSTVVSMASARR